VKLLKRNFTICPLERLIERYDLITGNAIAVPPGPLCSITNTELATSFFYAFPKVLLPHSEETVTFYNVCQLHFIRCFLIVNMDS